MTASSLPRGSSSGEQSEGSLYGQNRRRSDGDRAVISLNSLNAATDRLDRDVPRHQFSETARDRLSERYPVEMERIERRHEMERMQQHLDVERVDAVLCGGGSTLRIVPQQEINVKHSVPGMELAVAEQAQ